MKAVAVVGDVNFMSCMWCGFGI